MSDALSQVPAIPLARPPRRAYPERQDPKRGALDEAAAALTAPIVTRFARRRARRFAAIVPLVEWQEDYLSRLPDASLQRELRDTSIALRRSEARDRDAVARVFAIIREYSGRTLGKRHYPVQLMGGYALLDGTIAQMATGEGKTLTATLAAGAAGCAGMPTHIVTVNDYLAERDAALMKPLYDALGLSVGVIVAGMSLRDRQRAYACDLTYCTNKELAFDYLRDRIVLGREGGDMRLKLERLKGGGTRSAELRLRGLHFAIVDEADSVFIDEARTPLIISATDDSELDHEMIGEALELGRSLVAGRDYRLIPDERRAVMTEEGRHRVADLTDPLGKGWRNIVVRDELARQAVTALHLFQPGEHYLVKDGKVQIIDEYTGRLMPDRFWGEGLHQLIELKEGCELSGRRTTIARMTYQRLFRRYRRLSGMTGTAIQVADEMWRVYRLPVAAIPTGRPVQRRYAPDRVVPTAEEKWRLVTGRVGELHSRGAPVLIGTRSVAASEAASRHLDAAGLPHVVLSAAQDGEEAEIVAAAGRPGAITVATNMAGRGTDIQLGDGVAELGGLHVIMTERHDSRRIDDQLAGRCGRQGEPGSFEAILSLEDALFEMDRSGLLRRFGRAGMATFGKAAGRLAARLAQRRAEALHARMRRDLLQSDKKLNQVLAFSGRPE